MYLQKVEITNVKSIRKLKMDFGEKKKGWHVLLGMNGSGKSTILKAISLCLLGEQQSYSLRENFKEWITRDESSAKIKLSILLDKKQDALYSKFGPEINYQLSINADGKLIFKFGSNGKMQRMFPITPSHGWYNAGFGPFRRLGKFETSNFSKLSDGNLENHITLFDSDFTLVDGIKWLQQLKFEQLETNNRGTFQLITDFLNKSDFLPENVSIQRVDHEGVFFNDGEFENLTINQLSDGYKTMFSLTIEILRQINKRFNLADVIVSKQSKLVLIASGIILIDEIDIHLHPQWQSKIGQWFRLNFPNIQFVVTTHSPIICQSAADSKIWKVEHPKSGKQTEEVKGQDYKRMVFGNILDSYSTDNFGQETVVRSQQSKDLMQRLAELNAKSITGKATNSELEEIKNIKAILPTS